jgi:hypothetical protein
VLNALWSIICGQRYGHDDEMLQTILTKTSADLAETQYTGPLLFLPWLIKFAPRLTRWKAFTQSISSVHNFLQSIVNQHKQQRMKIDDVGSSMKNDFIDFYLSEIDATTDHGSSFYKEKGEHNLLIVLLDLFMGNFYINFFPVQRKYFVNFNRWWRYYILHTVLGISLHGSMYRCPKKCTKRNRSCDRIGFTNFGSS